VRVPEFAGTAFHEVEAKSALNRVPAASPVPFRWTVNPYRGCGHACVYCLAGPTPVLLADGRTRPIAELRAGDTVLGTAPGDRGRRYVRTTVLAHWSTTKPAHRVSLADGTDILASGEHRFLTTRGWRHVGAGWCRSGPGPRRRPRLHPGDVLQGPGALPGPRAHPESYRQGYLHGLVRADAALPVARDGRIDASFPSDRLELEALGRAHHFLASSRSAAGSRLVTVGAGGGAGAPVCRGLPPIGDAARRPRDPDDDWCAGFLAGVADAAGSSTAGTLRLATPGDELLGMAAGALHRLGFGFAVTASSDVPGLVRSRRHLRLTGGSRELLRFLAVADPAVSGVRDLAGAPVGADARLEVVDVRPVGEPLPMFDITTGTGDFVAAGAVSHNCFARNTHTYLDLDAGADFDRQIVVKVNVGRVLERELHAPRWRREPVAMGTNTDPYQRAEGRYRLMPGVVTALTRSGTPFSILTKGTVLSRDLPLLQAAAADVPVGLGVSIALLDRALQARLEPGTPSPAARLELVRRITDAGLPCGVMVAPVLPLLTDSAEALDALLARITAAGATSATVLALHLRPGTREWFLAWLEREHPDLVEPYARLYRRGAYVDPEYRRALAARAAPLLRRHGLAAGPPLPGAPPDGDARADGVPLHRRTGQGATVRRFGPPLPDGAAPRSSTVAPDVDGGGAQQLSLL
jgi:DNA repair photolyase